MAHPNDRYRVGGWVHIVKSNAEVPHPYGVITQVVPERGGCLVKPWGCSQPGGWGFEELEPLEGPPAYLMTSRFEREDVI